MSSKDPFDINTVLSRAEDCLICDIKESFEVILFTDLIDSQELRGTNDPKFFITIVDRWLVGVVGFFEENERMSSVFVKLASQNDV